MSPSLDRSSTTQSPPWKDGNFSQGFAYRYDVHDDDRMATGIVELQEALKAPSRRRPRLSILAAIADAMMGITVCFNVTPDIPSTVDLSISLLRETTANELVVETEVLKIGRSISSGELRFRETSDGPLVGRGFMSFAATRNPEAFLPELHRTTVNTGTIHESFFDYVGLRVEDGGAAAIDLTGFVANAAHSLQGGIVTLLGEVAIEELSGRDVIDLDVRFLRAVSVGPARATATLIGEDTYRAEVRDLGNNERVCAVVVARTTAS